MLQHVGDKIIQYFLFCKCFPEYVQYQTRLRPDHYSLWDGNSKQEYVKRNLVGWIILISVDSNLPRSGP